MDEYKILFVDDAVGSQDARQNLINTLAKDARFDITSLHPIQAESKLLKNDLSNDYSIIIVDYKLSTIADEAGDNYHKNGYSLTSLFKEKLPEIPVYLVSQIIEEDVQVAEHYDKMLSHHILTKELGRDLLASDCADYGENRDGVRINALIGGGMLFTTKLGMALGGALIGYILAFYDYKPDMVAGPDSDLGFGLMLLMVIIPAICHAIASFLYSRYKLDDNFLANMKK